MSGILKNVLAVSLFTVSAVSAAVIDDFERNDPGMPSSAAVTVAVVDAPEGSKTGKALSIAWPLPHKAFVEANYAKPVPLPLKAGEMAAIRFEAWIPATPSIIAISVRLLDAQNQTFQWMTKVPGSPTAGWRTIVIPLDPGTAVHWGGSNDGRLAYPTKLWGLTLVYANSAVPAGQVLIDNVRLDPLPTLALETDRFPSLVNTGDDGKCDLIVSNPFDHPIKLTVKGNLTTFSGAASEVTGALTAPAGGKSRLALPILDRRPGIRYLDATVRYDEVEFNYKTSFVIAAPVERTEGPDGFRFSICSHTEKSPTAEQELEFQAAAAAGANEMRTNDAWLHIQPKPDVWRWETQDRLVELASRYGIQIQLTLGFPPSWAVLESLRREQVEAYKQHNPDAWKISVCGTPEEVPWRAFVKAIVTRYRGKIKLYEIVNEPDLGSWRGTTDEYIQLLRRASEEIRRADPDAKVMTGGFATVLAHAGRAKNPDLQERVLAEASDAFDIHAIHQHDPFPAFKGAIQGELTRIRARMPHPRPLYFNETAMSSAIPYGGEKFQTTTLVKKMSYVMAVDAIGYTWYDLRNDGGDLGNGEHNYGLLTADFRPKASFAAYAEFVRQMQGMRHIGDLDLGPDREAHVFGGPRGRVIVWWNEGSNASAIPVLLRGGKGPVRAIDIMGAATELPQVDGFVFAQPSAEPQYIVMPAGEGTSVMEGLLVRLDGPRQAPVGEPLKLAAVVTNPWPRAITVDLAWTDTAGKAMTASVPVAAKATAQLPIVTKAATPRQPAHGMDLSYSVADIKWAGKIRFSAPVVRNIESAPPDNRSPDWVLDKRTDYVSFTDADPALAALNWRGPDDLSARVWVWQQEDAIRVRVDVRDDLHVQKEKVQDCWKGDSLQIAFQSASANQVTWQLGVAQADDGTLLRAAWASPLGTVNPESLFTAACSPSSGGLRYDVTLPCRALGLTDAALRDGLRFNLIVNDNDGNLRKGYMRIAPGIGDKHEPQAFPMIHFGK